jgi:hypothetical protein
MKITGGCHCGAITYEAEADPANASICHCTDCQQLTGAAFRTSIRADLGTFKILTGEPKIYVKIGDSGARRAQAFCANCGSPIYATAAEGSEPKSYNIRLGPLRADHPDLVPLGAEMAAGSRRHPPLRQGADRVTISANSATIACEAVQEGE